MQYLYSSILHVKTTVQALVNVWRTVAGAITYIKH